MRLIPTPLATPALSSCIPTARSKEATIRAPMAARPAFNRNTVTRHHYDALRDNVTRMTASIRILLVALLSVAFAGLARAHPHVWVTMKSELVYAPDGTITGVRHHWSFDDMFSTFAVQGLESKEKDKYTREELAPLAKVNVESLKEFDYFTYATADGKKTPMADPLPDYWLDYKDQILTLNFTLPF